VVPPHPLRRREDGRAGLASAPRGHLHGVSRCRRRQDLLPRLTRDLRGPHLHSHRRRSRRRRPVGHAQAVQKQVRIREEHRGTASGPRSRRRGPRPTPGHLVPRGVEFRRARLRRSWDPGRSGVVPSHVVRRPVSAPTESNEWETTARLMTSRSPPPRGPVGRWENWDSRRRGSRPRLLAAAGTVRRRLRRNTRSL
jgi:hypothetical protein